jgi:hypothetical protein
MNYENVVEEFNKKCCKLLVTKEEYNNIIISINRKKYNYRLKYIASCGHEHIVFYNVFKSYISLKINKNTDHPLSGSNRRPPS